MPTDDTERTRRSVILCAVADLAGELLYYGRREDEELPRGEIQSAIESGEITVDEIVAHFAAALDTELNGDD